MFTKKGVIMRLKRQIHMNQKILEKEPYREDSEWRIGVIDGLEFAIDIVAKMNDIPAKFPKDSQ